MPKKQIPERASTHEDVDIICPHMEGAILCPKPSQTHFRCPNNGCEVKIHLNRHAILEVRGECIHPRGLFVPEPTTPQPPPPAPLGFRRLTDEEEEEYRNAQTQTIYSSF